MSPPPPLGWPGTFDHAVCLVVEGRVWIGMFRRLYYGTSTPDGSTTVCLVVEGRVVDRKFSGV